MVVMAFVTVMNYINFTFKAIDEYYYLLQLILLLRILAQTQANALFYCLFAMMWFNNFTKVFYLLIALNLIPTFMRG